MSDSQIFELVGDADSTWFIDVADLVYVSELSIKSVEVRFYLRTKSLPEIRFVSSVTIPYRMSLTDARTPDEIEKIKSNIENRDRLIERSKQNRLDLIKAWRDHRSGVMLANFLEKEMDNNNVN
jgi:hypothetical protein